MRMFRDAGALMLISSFAFSVLAGCGPDKETEALRQENAALRREAENHDAIYGTSTPLTDGARAAAGLSTTPASGGAARTASVAADSDVTQKDIDEANRLGLPVYPNSKLSKQPGARDNSVLTGGGINVVLLETPDKIEPVVAFYLENMAKSNADPNMPGSTRPPARADRVQDKLRVVTLSDIQPGGGMRSVTVHEDVGRTYIELMNITGKQQIPASVFPQTGAANQPKASKPPAGSAAGATGAAGNASGLNSALSTSQSFGGQSSAGQTSDNDPLKPPLLLPKDKQ